MRHVSVTNLAGTYRVAAMQLLTEIVENSPSTALPKVPAHLFGALIMWLNIYKHTNLYHNLFQRLVFAVMRSGCEPAHRVRVPCAALFRV